MIETLSRLFGEQRQDILDDLRIAQATLLAISRAVPEGRPNPYRRISISLDIAVEFIRFLGKRPVGERVTTPLEWKKHKATHVMYLHHQGMEPSE